MVVQGQVAPEPVLDPESGVEDRVVLLRRPGFGPDAPEATEAPEARLRHMPVVVPEKAPGEGREVGRQGDACDDRERGRGPQARIQVTSVRALGALEHEAGPGDPDQLSQYTIREHWSQRASSPGEPLPRAADSASLEILRWQPPHLAPTIRTTTGIPRAAISS